MTMAAAVIVFLHLLYCNEDDGIVTVVFFVIWFVAKRMMAVAIVFLLNFVLLWKGWQQLNSCHHLLFFICFVAKRMITLLPSFFFIKNYCEKDNNNSCHLFLYLFCYKKDDKHCCWHFFVFPCFVTKKMTTLFLSSFCFSLLCCEEDNNIVTIIFLFFLVLLQKGSQQLSSSPSHYCYCLFFLALLQRGWRQQYHCFFLFSLLWIKQP